MQHTATHCNTLQHTATHCNTLQHTATHCNTLQPRTGLLPVARDDEDTTDRKWYAKTVHLMTYEGRKELKVNTQKR